MTSPYVMEAAEKADLRERVSRLEKALMDSQRYLIAWLPEYPTPGDPQRKRIIEQIDANSRALGFVE